MAEFETIVEVEKNVHFERLLTSDKEMQRKAQKAVRIAVRKARAALSKQAREGLDMSADPRAAYKAIKMAVYKRMLGGSVSILNPRRASGKRYVTPPAPDRRGKRGGNRMPRSQRTEDLLSYYGSDRGFVLRFLNQGTKQRTDEKRRGNRGSIAGRNWFGPASQQQLEQAAGVFEQFIEQAIAEANA